MIHAKMCKKKIESEYLFSVKQLKNAKLVDRLVEESNDAQEMTTLTIYIQFS